VKKGPTEIPPKHELRGVFIDPAETTCFGKRFILITLTTAVYNIFISILPATVNNIHISISSNIVYTNYLFSRVIKKNYIYNHIYFL